MNRCTGVFIILCLLFAGCAGAGNQGAATDRDQSPARTGYRFQKDQYRYLQDDGRFGIRNANPNLSDVGQWSEIKPVRTDAEKQMGAVARSVEGVKDAEVRIVGGHSCSQGHTREQNFPEGLQVVGGEGSQEIDLRFSSL